MGEAVPAGRSASLLPGGSGIPAGRPAGSGGTGPRGLAAAPGTRQAAGLGPRACRASPLRFLKASPDLGAQLSCRCASEAGSTRAGAGPASTMKGRPRGRHEAVRTSSQGPRQAANRDSSLRSLGSPFIAFCRMRLLSPSDGIFQAGLRFRSLSRKEADSACAFEKRGTMHVKGSGWRAAARRSFLSQCLSGSGAKRGSFLSVPEPGCLAKGGSPMRCRLARFRIGSAVSKPPIRTGIAGGALDEMNKDPRVSMADPDQYSPGTFAYTN